MFGGSSSKRGDGFESDGGGLGDDYVIRYSSHSGDMFRQFDDMFRSMDEAFRGIGSGLPPGIQPPETDYAGEYVICDGNDMSHVEGVHC